jgi:DNA-binding NarL/FixJ family response regulator
LPLDTTAVKPSSFRTQWGTFSAGPKASSTASRLSLPAVLTIREVEVLELVLDGLRNKEIAAELRIAERTVKAHREAIMCKLEVDSVARLVRKVYGCD